MITIVVVLVALGVLTWGFYRAKPYGQVGILAWLQSVALMLPWLLFFSLFTAGIYLNLVGILFLFVASTGLYVFLGNRLRAEGQKTALSQKATGFANATSTPDGESAGNPGEQNGVVRVATADPEAAIAMPPEDLKAVQGIFGIDTFFATETIPYQDGVIVKGNLRGDADPIHARLTRALEERLGDRYRLFLVENQEGRPVVIVLPSSNDPKPTTIFQAIFAAVLGLATLVTTLAASGLLLGFDLLNAPNRWREALPLAVGILTVFLSHEVGHRVLANRYQVKLSPPFFIPTWQIGSFGALTRFESLLPNRQVLFDVAFAGPAAAGILSFLMLLGGLFLSHPGSLFQVPSEFFQGSILVGTLARAILGAELQKPIVDIHPLTILGWLGLVVTALNLMPAGQLDGGRIVQAIYGRKIAGRATVATLVVLAIAALVNPLALYWAIIIVVLQRDLERPSLNELLEPDDTRAALGLLILFLMVVTLLPLTPSLAGRLGIGG